MKILIFLLSLGLPIMAQAFCGFFVGKAGAELFNESSQVVVARDGDRTVVSMANDYKGEPKEFALVVPVPVILKKEQVHVTDPANITALDGFTSPRLAEYHESDPCNKGNFFGARVADMVGAQATSVKKAKKKPKALGVKIEEKYTVGEYDILILSAKRDDGLLIWLNENGYKTPPAATPILKSYIKQGLKFFVAKVNLKEKSKSKFAKLRPLQIAYESKKFMLPIRLGTVNSKGLQDLIVYLMSPKGRIEVSNYATVKVPANMDLPVAVKKNFQRFYKDMFIHQAQKESNKAVFLEYAWDMGWCDPCASEPLSSAQLKELGAMWLVDPQGGGGGARPPTFRRRGGGVNAYVTRLHIRYSKDSFPEDLMFFETTNRENYQARYVLRHKWEGAPKCDQAKDYLASVKGREHKEAMTLANLTGWKSAEIQKHLDLKVKDIKKAPWYKRLWQ